MSIIDKLFGDSDKPDGLAGNDDLGQMSAWYVFSSWGIYPTMSGANFFVLSSPQFPRTEITIGDLVKLIAEKCGFKGELRFDPNMPDDRGCVQP